MFRSVVFDHGEDTSMCDYCNASTQTRIVHGLWAYSLTVDDYQGLLDRGWRRSGMYLYKPNMQQICCPQYTIRLQATSFIPSKEQRRVLNRMKSYLDGSYKGRKTMGKICEKISDMPCCRKDEKDNPDSPLFLSESCLPSDHNVSVRKENCHNRFKAMGRDEVTREWISLAIKNAIAGLIEEGQLPENISFPEVIVKQVTAKIKNQLKAVNSRAVYTTNVAFSLAANASKGYGSFGPRKIRLQTNPNLDYKKEELCRYSSTVLAEELASKLQSCWNLHGLTIKACKGHINFSEDNQLEDGTSEVAKLCQKKSNGSMPVHVGLKETSFILPSTNHTLDTCMRRSEYDPEEFSLYKKYQVAVHNDKPEQVTKSGYKQFLVDTPLIPVPPAEDGSTPFCGFGSFHQQYRIDGQLVAVVVVDILPRCLSSKYLFWDPDFAFLSLGKYSALHEINWIQESRTVCHHWSIIILDTISILVQRCDIRQHIVHLNYFALRSLRGFLIVLLSHFLISSHMHAFQRHFSKNLALGFLGKKLCKKCPML